MKKKRIIGVIMMTVATVIGVYVGIGYLLIKPIIELWGMMYDALEVAVIIINIIKIFIIFPMVLTFVFFLWAIGRAIFLDN